MELRQLEYVVAIADTGSFTRAAQLAHVAQPGISSQIRRLEGELGVELFARTSRRVELTEAGRAVLPSARAALRAVAEIRRTVEELTGLERGQVTVGTMLTTATPQLVGLLGAFRRRHPGVDVRMRVDRSDRLLAAVAGGSVDVAVVGLAGDPPTGVRFHPTLDDLLVAVVAPDHPLARRRRLPLAELCRHDLVAMAEGTGIRSAFDEAVTSIAASATVAIEAATPDAVADFAAAGFGVGVVPTALAAARDDVVAVPIVAPAVRGQLGFAWPADPGGRPARRALAAFVEEQLAAT